MSNSPRERAKHIAAKAFPFGETARRDWLAGDIEQAIGCAVAASSPPQSGWSCPRCTRIYGPSVQICVVCNTKVAASEVK